MAEHVDDADKERPGPEAGPRIAVILGSVRSMRQGIHVARFVVNRLEERGVRVTLIDPKEWDLPLLDRRYMDYAEGEAPERFQRLHAHLDDAEGYVLVSAEYNHGVPPALKNLLDHFYHEYAFKAAGIVTYSASGFGGVRVSDSLRAIAGELGMVTAGKMFHVSKVHEVFDDEGKLEDAAYDRRVKPFLDEFMWYVDAVRTKRERDGTPR